LRSGFGKHEPDAFRSPRASEFCHRTGPWTGAAGSPDARRPDRQAAARHNPATGPRHIRGTRPTAATGTNKSAIAKEIPMPSLNPSARHWSALTAFLAIALLLAGIMPQPARASDMAKVVYHADFADPRRFSSMLTSINNMVTYYQNELIDYDVRIVFVAHGIRFVTDDKLDGTPFQEDAEMAERRANNAGRLQSLQSVQGVKLELCDITRSQVGLAADKLYDGVDQVPSGVVQIARLQSEGFAYIKIE
jgi:intracellular sulfur oxidation DsrE/DsrF family protein